ncbi:chloride channel protein [Rouxiella badensis]|jgi:H+/Cl- antiporter ClcA|uniref:chloride channel protein n=1 Tax=Rouxiella badensis TaxID=1646377 RepID=UPI001B6549CB|nr:chloride channel protein [Rouxiella badensis]MCC3701794.1 chloride channel protein [Rouxiella badensis]MCC3731436.1 chloride channel protein [Rouxiella badensis]MCC3748843.1 chloride channel protein [Rouxiella badensis]MCC3756825.1 chloride channel protein [Rouxiella badensis]
MSEQHVEPRSGTLSLIIATLLTGIAAGIGGMLLALLLHAIQHLAFGYSPDAIISQESFLEGVSAANASRRFYVLVSCGLIAGIGWYLLYRFGKPLVSIAHAVKNPQKPMPFFSTLVHALLQIITVALGSPLGREVAPREVGAIGAGWLSQRFRLTPAETRVMVACGAGAGLAAVYNVPLGGAVFTLEVLLGAFSWELLIPAVCTSSIAALVAWAGLGNESQYHLPELNITSGLVIWSVICGPLFGIAANAFTRVMTQARKQAKRNWQMPVFCLLNFAILGLLSAWFPQLLGNGKGPAQITFDNQTTLYLAAALLVLKLLVIWGSLRSGAEGGLLTPGLSNGALLACILGGVWDSFWPGTSIGAFAIVGAAAFLASSMKMPITAVVLILEFTRVNHDFLIPILFAVTGSIATSALINKKWAV